MDAQQQQLLFRAIAVSSLPGFSTADRQAAFTVLQEFQHYPARMQLCMRWLLLPLQPHSPQHASTCTTPTTTTPPLFVYEQHDITLSVQLLALDIMDSFLITGYTQCTAAERLELRRTILTAAATTATAISQQQQQRVVSRKLAVVLKGLILRDFPQRWTELPSDLFGQQQQQSLWTTPNGRSVVLEALKLVAEDCVDSDFNSQISNTRRADVVKGLNEIAASHFLPLLFQLLETNVPALQQSKAALHRMHSYLASEKRTVQSLEAEERATHQAEQARREALTVLLQDTLVTLEHLCLALPTSLFFGGEGTTPTTVHVPAGNNNTAFVAAFLHLFREPSLQIQAVKCVEQLVHRKLSLGQWKRLVYDLPASFEEANQLYTNQEREQKSAEIRANGTLNDTTDSLVDQFEFHRSLSRLLSSVIANYIAHLSVDSTLLAGKGPDVAAVSTYLSLLVSMLEHPSGRILSEQVVMWNTIYRDPVVSQSKLLAPHAAATLAQYLKHVERIRWEDVENETHSHGALMEASFDDEEDYDKWVVDFRSKTSMLFRFIGICVPDVAVSVVKDRVQAVVTAYGAGSSDVFLDPTNHQLTRKSNAVMQFESLYQPLENILAGIPDWTLSDSAAITPGHRQGRKQAEVQTIVQSHVLEITTTLVQWKPTFVWLKLRHASLLETLRHVWKHNPAMLLDGIDTLLKYMGLPDEWAPSSTRMSEEMTGFKKRSGVALVSIAKQVPSQLVLWLAQLSEAAKRLLSSDGLVPLNQMHLYEFLSCVASSVDDYRARSQFISDVLSDAIGTLEKPEVQQAIKSTEALLGALGVIEAAKDPSSVANPSHVNQVQTLFYQIFNPLNRLLSVGRRCHEAASKKTVLCGVPTSEIPRFGGIGEPSSPQDEGPLTLEQLSYSDPFVLLWPRILPIVLNAYSAVMGAWSFEIQSRLLQNNIQRYLYAISDDEAYLARDQSNKPGGVFGEEGTAGCVVTGLDRKQANLLPKWSGWMTELRNTCFQLVGLLMTQRALYSAELAGVYPNIVTTLVDPRVIRSMEHRHMSQFLKQVIEYLLLSCPSTLYPTHLGPIVGPVLEHMRYRLEKSWLPIISPTALPIGFPPDATNALRSDNCNAVSVVASRGEEYWFDWCYAHAGLFVGELDVVTSESAVEKQRVNLNRTFSDVLQSCLALKGDWSLVLANFAKEERATKKDNATILQRGPSNMSGGGSSTQLNANGTEKLPFQSALDARKLLRINGLCRFLLLEDQRCAGNLALASIQCLSYPDAYSCRRVIKVLHRIVETVAWSPLYSQLLGQHLFGQAVNNIVVEPKWMVGMEWEMINLIRDVYCRLWLGQWLQFGGQGSSHQQPVLRDAGYEQTKLVDQPLQGGGILTSRSSLPRSILAELPSIGEDHMQQFDAAMMAKRSAKDQKDILRDLLRAAADSMDQQRQHNHTTNGQQQQQTIDRLFSTAVLDESLLRDKGRAKAVPDIPEKLILRSSVVAKENENQPSGLNDIFQ